MAKGEGTKAAGVVAVVIALIVFAAGIFALRGALARHHAQGNGSDAAQSDDGTQDQTSPTPQDEGEEGPIPEGLGFEQYSWDQLSEISSMIADAGGGEASRAVAARYGIVDASGALTSESKEIILADGTTVGVQVVGICHDVRDDGTVVGLSLMTTAPITVAPLGASADDSARWQDCELRAWLSKEGLDLLPEELRRIIVPVSKACLGEGLGGTGFASYSIVDTLWLPSAHEICGDIDWFDDEYGSTYAYLDSALNLEGTQYELFASQGVTARKDQMHSLVCTYDGVALGWWYRTTFPFVYDEMPESFFYHVSDTGYPCSYSDSDTVLGVRVGFCI